jgi:transcription elongation factor GreA
MSSTTPLSRAAFERLQAELEDLTTMGRVRIANQIEKARSLGDLSENGDYHAAKDEQGKMEARIRQLQHLLSTAEIVEDPADGGKAANAVTNGSTVSIRYEGDDDIERYYIGSIEERRDDLTVISHGSPLGQALMGHKAGDTVEFEAPSGPLKVEIVAIGD